jgi:tetratricopeptide (TPR) repeat protein
MQSAGQFRDAVPMLERALKIREAMLPPNHPDIATNLNNLAVAHWNSGVYNRHQRALEYLERSLKINETNLGPEHPEIATALINIATILDMTWRQYLVKNLYNQPVEEMIQKREKEREGLFKRALKILETHRGPNDYQVAICLDRFGNMLLADSKYEQAEPLFRRCLKIRETQLPFTHPDVIETLETLIRIHAMRDQWGKVADLLDDVNRRMRLHVRHNLPSLSTPQQLAFLQRTHVAAFHRCLTLPFLRPDDPALIMRAAEWVLNGKAVTQEARAEQAALLLDSKDPQAPQLAQQLLKVRAEMEQCRRFSPRTTQEEDKKRSLHLAQLEEQESLLVAKLNVSAAGHKQKDDWVKLDDVRARIPANAVLIEIVDFDLWDFKKHDW